jgi:hypothetical protein
LPAASAPGAPPTRCGTGRTWAGAGWPLEFSALDDASTGSGSTAFADSAGAVFCNTGGSETSGLAGAWLGADAGSDDFGLGRSSGIACTGACGAAAKGTSLAVSANSAFDGGAGDSWTEMPSSTSACSTIETSTHRSNAVSRVIV